MTPSAGVPLSRIGMGDPIGRVEFALVSGEGGLPSVSVVGALKAPLADVNGGFGAGKWDVGAGLSSALSLGGTSVFADAVYWKLGLTRTAPTISTGLAWRVPLRQRHDASSVR